METGVNTVVVPWRDKLLLHAITVGCFVMKDDVKEGAAEVVIRLTHPLTGQKHQVKQLIDRGSIGNEGYLKWVAFALAEDYLKRRESDDIASIP